MDELKERLALQELTARYAFYVDTFQVEPLMELWAGDAIFDESRSGTGYYEGLGEIRHFFEDVFRIMSHTVHLTGNHIIEKLSPQTAEGLCFCQVEGLTKTGNRLRALIYYKDSYAKVDGRWRFRARVVHPLMPVETDAYRSEMRS